MWESHAWGLSADEPHGEMENVLAQSTVSSNQFVLQAENSESSLVSTKETQDKLAEQILKPT